MQQIQSFRTQETARCKKTTAVCPTCYASDHDLTKIPIQKTEAKCANCGGNRNVAYRGRPKSKQVKSILTASAKLSMSYRDVAAHCKKTVKEKTKPTTAASPAIHSSPTSGQETTPIKTIMVQRREKSTMRLLQPLQPDTI